MRKNLIVHSGELDLGDAINLPQERVRSHWELSLCAPRVDVQLHSFLTLVLGEGKSSAYTPGTIPQSKKPRSSIIRWAPEAVWTSWRKKEFLALPGFEPRLLGCSARNNSHYGDYTISFPATAKETCRHLVLSNHNAAGFTLIKAVLQFNICYSNEVNRGRDKSCM